MKKEINKARTWSRPQITVITQEDLKETISMSACSKRSSSSCSKVHATSAILPEFF